MFVDDCGIAYLHEKDVDTLMVPFVDDCGIAFLHEKDVNTLLPIS